MKKVAILAEKGGTGKTATSHLVCLGAYLHNEPAACAVTDPRRKVRSDGRPYAVLDGRLPEQLALILDSSRHNLNGWLFIDGGGNRPEFDIELAKHVDLTLVMFRPSDEDIDATAQTLTAIPWALAWPCAWPTNAFAVEKAKRFVEELGAKFPQRIISPAIPFVNSMCDLLSDSLETPSTSVRVAARNAFEVVSDYYDTHGQPEKADALFAGA